MKKSRRAPQLDLETLMPQLMKQWRRYHQIKGPDDRLQTREFRRVAAAVATLSTTMGKEPHLFDDPDFLGAYLLYYWPLHYQQGISLINELPSPPARILDLCSGPTPFGFAALRHGASELVACDRSATALQLGAAICGRYGFPVTLEPWTFPAPIPSMAPFDLIIVGHALRCLFPDITKGWQQRQRDFILGLLEMLNNGGHLLLVDGSRPEANSRFLTMRDQLIAAGAVITAPCIWEGRCPALQGSHPCYAQRRYTKPHLMAELQRATNINLSSLKMSYLLVAKGAPTSKQRLFYRVISPPVATYSGKRYYLCGSDGKKKLESHLAIHPKASRAFDYLERGALIKIDNALIQGDTIHIIEGTTLSVVAAPGKAEPTK